MAGDAPGAASAAAVVKAFKCRACGADVTLRAAGQSLVATCSACGALVDVSDDNYRIIAQYERRKEWEPLIPLGTRGQLRGETFEMIGFLRRTDKTGLYVWEEYLLFNPYRGFRWLHHYHGHWTYLLVTKSKPAVAGRVATYLNKRYRLFDKGQARVAYVLGEFYWRVKVGDIVDTEDYVSPPEILSMERDADEVVWSLGEYVEPEDIKQAFRLSQRLPPKIGVAPNQPSPIASAMWSTIQTRLLLFAAALLVIQFVASSVADNTTVDQEGSLSAGLPKPQVLRSFDVTGASGNLAVDVSCANLRNNWLDLDLELVNEATGEARAVSKSFEYYSGVDSDGSWTEGSRQGRIVIPAVPAGRYHLNVEAASDAPGLQFTLAVKRGVLVWSNFFLALALLLLGPALLWWRKLAYETTRWSESDYSPYPHPSNDDD